LNDTEQAVARIWREVIRVTEVRRNDNFFDIGGHSLLATQVVSRLAKAFNVEVSLRSIFEAPTLAALAEVVAAAPRQSLKGPAAIPRASKADELLSRLDELTDNDLEELLRDPELKEVLS
jgi:acyl carrier protein